MKKEITEEMLTALRERVTSRLSEKRAYHTLCVEKMTIRLCELFCPEETAVMRGAALLHDVTKEIDTAGQEELCRRLGIPVTDETHYAPKTYHGMTAAALIPIEFSAFADDTLISAVRWHTTGHKDMTLTEKILYLADYVDESRRFENCVLLRHFFFDAKPEELPMEKRLSLLRDTLILSYQFTVKELLEKGTPIAKDTVDAMNDLLLEAMKEKEGREKK